MVNIDKNVQKNHKTARRPEALPRLFRHSATAGCSLPTSALRSSRAFVWNSRAYENAVEHDQKPLQKPTKTPRN